MADDPYATLASGMGSVSIPKSWGASFTRTIHTTPSPTIDPSKVTLPSGYTIVVTGAGKGIGEYIAKAYVAAKAQNVIITSRTPSDLERVKTELESIAKEHNHNVSVTICPGDATEPESYKRIVELLERSYGGRLDCLVTNAGGGDLSQASKALHENDPDIFTAATALNYTGPYFAMMTLMPLLLKSPAKTIINISSGSLHTIEIPPASYNVAKLANLRMTEIVAALYAAQGLKCFAVHPGHALTPAAYKQAPNSLAIFTEDIRLAGAVCVWLSNENPVWASGRYISSTWDMDEFKAMREEIVKGDKLKYRMVV